MVLFEIHFYLSRIALYQQTSMNFNLETLGASIPATCYNQLLSNVIVILYQEHIIET